MHVNPGRPDRIKREDFFTQPEMFEFRIVDGL